MVSINIYLKTRKQLQKLIGQSSLGAREGFQTELL